MSDADKRILYSLLPGTLFVGLMWLVNILGYLLHLNLAIFGIYPRALSALPHILIAPLIHGDLLHLLSNSFPLVVLSAIILFSYRRVSGIVFLGVYILSGFWTWYMGREAFHIGASGLVYGLAAFLFFSGLFRGDRTSLAISFVVLFLYGGFIYGIIPAENGVSWEAHLGGLLAGMFLALYFRRVDLPKREEEALEDEEEEESEEEETARLEAMNNGDYFEQEVVHPKVQKEVLPKEQVLPKPEEKAAGAEVEKHHHKQMQKPGSYGISHNTSFTDPHYRHFRYVVVERPPETGQKEEARDKKKDEA